MVVSRPPEATPTSTDLRAFTQISPVASLIVIQSPLSYCLGGDVVGWGNKLKYKNHKWLQRSINFVAGEQVVF